MNLQLLNIPENTLVKQATINNDYEECYRIHFESKQNIALDTIIYDCFSVFSSGWVDSLFRLRNILVKPFGLETTPDKKPNKKERAKIVKKGYVSFFEVKDLNDEEVLLFAKDKHLSAYFSFLLSQNGESKNLYAITTVQLSNRLGKYYFAVVKPFHKLIIKNMLRNVGKHYTKY